jgi:hypothetical protein
MATCQARPPPLLRPGDEVGPHRISFYVPQDRVQVLVGLEGKRLEPSLVQMAGSRSMVVREPALAMGYRQPVEEVGHLLVGSRFRPDHPVAVSGHHGIGEDSQRFPRMRFFDDAFELGVVGLFAKQRRGSVRDRPQRELGRVSGPGRNHRPKVSRPLEDIGSAGWLGQRPATALPVGQ